jgi:branched-chain amino acid transport system permease protein
VSAAAARRTGILAVVATVLVVLPWLHIGTGGVFPGELSSPGALQVLGLMLVFGALAITYDLLLGYTGLLSFGHALFFAIGVYVTDIVMAHAGLPLLPAIGVSVGVCAAVALVVGAVSLRVEGIAFAMVTLAFAQAVSIVVTQDLLGLTGGDLGLGLPSAKVPSSLLGVVNTRNLYWVALVLLAVVAAVAWLLVSSPAGRVWQAVRENERRVEVLGLRPYPYKLLSFVAASVLASLCGAVYLLLVTGAQPQVTTPDFTLSLLVMVVLGGAGRIWGAAIGGAIYTFLDQRLTDWSQSGTIAGLPDFIRVPLSQPLFVLGLLFVLFILFVPGGIAGVVTRSRPRLDLRAVFGRRVRRPAVTPAPGVKPEPPAEVAEHSRGGRDA